MIPRLAHRSLPGVLAQCRFASTLVFLESGKDKKISQSSLSALSAATQLGNPVTALLAGSSASESAEQLKLTVGPALLDKIVVAESQVYDHYLPEVVTPLCLELLKDPEYSHFVVASSAFGKNILPRVGALLDYQPICDITKVIDPSTFVRPIYAGNVLATVQCTQDKKLISVRASSFAAAGSGSCDVSISAAPQVETPQINVKWEGENLVESARPDLGSANTVVSGGRGLKSKESFDKLAFGPVG